MINVFGGFLVNKMKTISLIYCLTKHSTCVKIYPCSIYCFQKKMITEPTKGKTSNNYLLWLNSVTVTFYFVHPYAQAYKIAS